MELPKSVRRRAGFWWRILWNKSVALLAAAWVALGDTERRRWDHTLGFLEEDVTTLELILTMCDSFGRVAPWGETRPRDIGKLTP